MFGTKYFSASAKKKKRNKKIPSESFLKPDPVQKSKIACELRSSCIEKFKLKRR